MRSFKTYLVVVMITITALNADAQAPGYLGKRFIVGYDIYAMPALRHFNENGKKGILAYNTRHEFSVDWITSINRSVGMSVQFTKSTFELNRGIYFSYINDDDYPSEQNLYYGNTTGELSAFTIGLHTNLYFNEFIAPVGAYFRPEILLINFSATFDPDEANKNLVYDYGSPATTYPPVLANKKSYYTAAIGGTIGTHYVFFDRLVFNIGFQAGFVFGGKVLSELMERDGVPNKSITEDNYISVVAKARLMSQYFININAGLSILIF